MNLPQAHLDVARERFLELMAETPASDARTTASRAIEQADAFIAAYGAFGMAPLETPVAPAAPKLKGCKQCFGSGGKVNAPCRSCGGSGKVAP